jgi:hypothetical protein
MTLTKLDWPARPKRTIDPSFGRRLTWRCKTDAYQISSIPEYLKGEYCLTYPRWACKLPTRHRSLRAAQKAAQLHRNEVRE